MTHAQHSPESSAEHAVNSIARGNGVRALATITLVCASFTFTASLVLMAYTVARPEMDFIHDPSGLLLRVLLFGALSGAAAFVLWRARHCSATSMALSPPEALSSGTKAVLAALVLVIALLLGIRLADYPWAAPDEVHHLVVARNLAIHGVYASGHPDSGYRYFDSFDSVGPVVLGPIALAFKMFGAHLAVARGVMVLFYLGLSLATFAFTRGLFGVRAGLLSVGLLLGTYSSIYLGRTLYGEVPAHLFLLLGLMAWRKALGTGEEAGRRYKKSKPASTESLSSPRMRGSSGLARFTSPRHWIFAFTGKTKNSTCLSVAQHEASPTSLASAGISSILWGLLAGALLACAVLSKTILVLVAFSFLGVWVYDRLTFRRIGWRAVVFPCMGGLGVMAAWSVFQRLHGAPATESGGVLAIYQHYLLFGVSSVTRAIEHAVLPHPLAHLAWFAVLIATVPVLFGRRYDPPAIVLYLYAMFLLYWWFFFTPGHLHRYLWNAYAILAIFASPWLLTAWQRLLQRRGSMLRRGLALAVVLALAGPPVQWTLMQAREIYTNNELKPEYALLDAVHALPESTTLATDIDRMPGLVNFFEGRLVRADRDPIALLAQFDVVITRDTPALRAALPPVCVVQPAGAFVLLSTPQRTE